MQVSNLAYDGVRLLEEIPSGNADWRYDFLRASIHEQMFRRGSNRIYMPNFGSIGPPSLPADPSAYFYDSEAVEQMDVPLSIVERQWHLHSAFAVAERFWSKALDLDAPSRDEIELGASDIGSETLLCHSFLLGSLYDHGAVHLLEAMLEHGPVVEENYVRVRTVFVQDLIIMHGVPSFRQSAVVDARQDANQNERIWLMKHVGESSRDLIDALRDSEAQHSLEEALDMYSSVIRVGDRLLGEREPYRAIFYPEIRTAAVRYLELVAVLDNTFGVSYNSLPEIKSRAKFWANAKRPRSRKNVID